jgi:hypothetical protein
VHDISYVSHVVAEGGLLLLLLLLLLCVVVARLQRAYYRLVLQLV